MNFSVNLEPEKVTFIKPEFTMKKFLIYFFLIAFNFEAFTQKQNSSLTQKQNNSPGSDIFVDTPTFIDLSKDSIIPITFYLHESECLGCNNYLNYIDIQMKCASDPSFDNVLVFDTLSDSQFASLFSAYSQNDLNWNSQSFIDSKPVSDNQHTIVFSADTNWWFPPVPVANINKRYFYFNFNIPYETWKKYLCSDSIIDIHVYISIDLDTDEEFWLRIFVKKNAYVSLPNWFRGDTHVHGICTQNNAENGLPIEATKIAASYLGLDWITLTDHSCDFDNYGVSMQQNWQNLGKLIDSLNTADSTVILIRGLEAAVINSQGKVVHCLVYPNPQQPFSMPYFFDGGGDWSSTNITIDMMLDSLIKYNGFCYAAHPFAEGDVLPWIINGGSWNLSDSLSPQNGQSALSEGTVVWNDLAFASDIYASSDSIVIKNPIMGLENLNLLNTLKCTDTERDPWNTQNNSEPFGFYEMPETDYMHPNYRFTQNMEAYSFIVRKGLKVKNQNPSAQHWKIFLSAGSDAHGSFNYSNTDFFYSGLNGAMENNHLGAFSTLVYCPNGMGHNGQHVLQALKDGHALLSTGPIVNLTIQTPSQNLIVGDDADLTYENENNIFIHLDALTNYYYGDISFVRLIIQTQDTAYTIPVSLTNGSFDISFHDLIMQNISLFNVLPLNQYIAIRAELGTEKTYSSTEALYYRRNSQKFYAYTNPIWVKIGLFTDINEQLEKIISVFPNPAHNYCIVRGINNTANCNIQLFDISGRNIPVSYTKSKNEILINMENLLSGFYCLEIKSKDVTIKKKILKH